MKMPILFLGFVIFSEHCFCADVIKIEGANLCIPSRHAVIVQAGTSFGRYDSDDSTYDVSLIFAADELVFEIPGYMPKVHVDDNPKTQSLYVILGKVLTYKEFRALPRGAVIVFPTRLFRTEPGEIAWQVLEKKEDRYVHWGYCSDTFDSAGSFDCMRDLQASNLKLSYPIHMVNLRFYEDIDRFLIERIRQWHCGNSN